MADRVALFFCGLLLGMASAAAETPDEEERRDAEFIEYLGLWQESDELWLMLDEERDDEQDGEEMPEPETDDES